MKNLFFFLFLLALAWWLGGCSKHMAPPQTSTLTRPLTAADSSNQAINLGLDSLRPVAPASIPPSKKTVLTRVLKLFKTHDAEKVVHIGSNASFKKCKNCTTIVNHVTGNQTNEHTTVGKKGQAATGNSHLEAQTKTKGPASSGTSSAKDLSNAGIASDVTGNNNAPQLTNTAPPKISGWDLFLDNMSSPLGKVLAGIVGALLVIGFVKYGLPLLLKKKATDSTRLN